MVAAESGGYPFAFDAVATGSMTAADASNPRVDLLYVLITDPEDGATTPTAHRTYLAGTAAASPTAPATPAGGIPIAQINVPKSGGGSPTVTWVAQTAVAAGGILPIDTLAHLNLITGSKGSYAEVTADSTNNGLYKWSGAAWVPAAGGLPDPVIFGSDVSRSITATSWTTMNSATRSSITVAHDCWVEFIVQTWISASSGSVQVGLALSGATTQAPDGPGGGFTAITSSSTAQKSVAHYVVKLTAGTTNLDVQAQRTGSGTCIATDNWCTVVPLRWA
jgi:hypothetical protein